MEYSMSKVAQPLGGTDERASENEAFGFRSDEKTQKSQTAEKTEEPTLLEHIMSLYFKINSDHDENSLNDFPHDSCVNPLINEALQRKNISKDLSSNDSKISRKGLDAESFEIQLPVSKQLVDSILTAQGTSKIEDSDTVDGLNDGKDIQCRHSPDDWLDEAVSTENAFDGPHHENFNFEYLGEVVYSSNPSNGDVHRVPVNLIPLPLSPSDASTVPNDEHVKFPDSIPETSRLVSVVPTSDEHDSTPLLLTAINSFHSSESINNDGPPNLKPISGTHHNDEPCETPPVIERQVNITPESSPKPFVESLKCNRHASAAGEDLTAEKGTSLETVHEELGDKADVHSSNSSSVLIQMSQPNSKKGKRTKKKLQSKQPSINQVDDNLPQYIAPDQLDNTLNVRKELLDNPLFGTSTITATEKFLRKYHGSPSMEQLDPNHHKPRRKSNEIRGHITNLTSKNCSNKLNLVDFPQAPQLTKPQPSLTSSDNENSNKIITRRKSLSKSAVCCNARTDGSLENSTDFSKGIETIDSHGLAVLEKSNNIDSLVKDESSPIVKPDKSTPTNGFTAVSQQCKEKRRTTGCVKEPQVATELRPTSPNNCVFDALIDNSIFNSNPQPEIIPVSSNSKDNSNSSDIDNIKEVKLGSDLKVGGKQIIQRRTLTQLPQSSKPSTDIKCKIKSSSCNNAGSLLNEPLEESKVECVGSLSKICSENELNVKKDKNLQDKQFKNSDVLRQSTGKKINLISKHKAANSHLIESLQESCDNVETQYSDKMNQRTNEETRMKQDLSQLTPPNSGDEIKEKKQLIGRRRNFRSPAKVKTIPVKMDSGNDVYAYTGEEEKVGSWGDYKNQSSSAVERKPRGREHIPLTNLCKKENYVDRSRKHKVNERNFGVKRTIMKTLRDSKPTKSEPRKCPKAKKLYNKGKSPRRRGTLDCLTNSVEGNFDPNDKAISIETCCESSVDSAHNVEINVVEDKRTTRAATQRQFMSSPQRKRTDSHSQSSTEPVITNEHGSNSKTLDNSQSKESPKKTPSKKNTIDNLSRTVKSKPKFANKASYCMRSRSNDNSSVEIDDHSSTRVLRNKALVVAQPKPKRDSTEVDVTDSECEISVTKPKLQKSRKTPNSKAKTNVITEDRQALDAAKCSTLIVAPKKELDVTTAKRKKSLDSLENEFLPRLRSGVGNDHPEKVKTETDKQLGKSKISDVISKIPFDSSSNSVLNSDCTEEVSLQGDSSLLFSKTPDDLVICPKEKVNKESFPQCGKDVVTTSKKGRSEVITPSSKSSQDVPNAMGIVSLKSTPIGSPGTIPQSKEPDNLVGDQHGDEEPEGAKGLTRHTQPGNVETIVTKRQVTKKSLLASSKLKNNSAKSGKSTLLTYCGDINSQIARKGTLLDICCSAVLKSEPAMQEESETNHVKPKNPSNESSSKKDAILSPKKLIVLKALASTSAKDTIEFNSCDTEDNTRMEVMRTICVVSEKGEELIEKATNEVEGEIVLQQISQIPQIDTVKKNNEHAPSVDSKLVDLGNLDKIVNNLRKNKSQNASTRDVTASSELTEMRCTKLTGVIVSPNKPLYSLLSNNQPDRQNESPGNIIDKIKGTPFKKRPYERDGITFSINNILGNVDEHLDKKMISFNDSSCTAKKADISSPSKLSICQDSADSRTHTTPVHDNNVTLPLCVSTMSVERTNSTAQSHHFTPSPIETTPKFGCPQTPNLAPDIYENLRLITSSKQECPNSSETLQNTAYQSLHDLTRTNFMHLNQLVTKTDSNGAFSTRNVDSRRRSKRKGIVRKFDFTHLKDKKSILQKDIVEIVNTLNEKGGEIPEVKLSSSKVVNIPAGNEGTADFPVHNVERRKSVIETTDVTTPSILSHDLDTSILNVDESTIENNQQSTLETTVSSVNYVSDESALIAAESGSGSHSFSVSSIGVASEIILQTTTHGIVENVLPEELDDVDVSTEEYIESDIVENVAEREIAQDNGSLGKETSDKSQNITNDNGPDNSMILDVQPCESAKESSFASSATPLDSTLPGRYDLKPCAFECAQNIKEVLSDLSEIENPSQKPLEIFYNATVDGSPVVIVEHNETKNILDQPLGHEIVMGNEIVDGDQNDSKNSSNNSLEVIQNYTVDDDHIVIESESSSLQPLDIDQDVTADGGHDESSLHKSLEDDENYTVDDDHIVIETENSSLQTLDIDQNLSVDSDHVVIADNNETVSCKPLEIEQSATIDGDHLAIVDHNEVQSSTHSPLEIDENKTVYSDHTVVAGHETDSSVYNPLEIGENGTVVCNHSVDHKTPEISTHNPLEIDQKTIVNGDHTAKADHSDTGMPTQDPLSVDHNEAHNPLEIDECERNKCESSASNPMEIEQNTVVVHNETETPRHNPPAVDQEDCEDPDLTARVDHNGAENSPNNSLEIDGNRIVEYDHSVISESSDDNKSKCTVNNHLEIDQNTIVNGDLTAIVDPNESDMSTHNPLEIDQNDSEVSDGTVGVNQIEPVSSPHNSLDIDRDRIDGCEHSVIVNHNKSESSTNNPSDNVQDKIVNSELVAVFDHNETESSTHDPLEIDPSNCEDDDTVRVNHDEAGSTTHNPLEVDQNRIAECDLVRVDNEAESSSHSEIAQNTIVISDVSAIVDHKEAEVSSHNSQEIDQNGCEGGDLTVDQKKSGSPTYNNLVIDQNSIENTDLPAIVEHNEMTSSTHNPLESDQNGDLTIGVEQNVAGSPSYNPVEIVQNATVNGDLSVDHNEINSSTPNPSENVQDKIVNSDLAVVVDHNETESSTHSPLEICQNDCEDGDLAVRGNAAHIYLEIDQNTIVNSDPSTIIDQKEAEVFTHNSLEIHQNGCEDGVHTSKVDNNDAGNSTHNPEINQNTTTALVDHYEPKMSSQQPPEMCHTANAGGDTVTVNPNESSSDKSVEVIQSATSSIEVDHSLTETLPLLQTDISSDDTTVPQIIDTENHSVTGKPTCSTKEDVIVSNSCSNTETTATLISDESSPLSSSELTKCVSTTTDVMISATVVEQPTINIQTQCSSLINNEYESADNNTELQSSHTPDNSVRSNEKAESTNQLPESTNLIDSVADQDTVSFNRGSVTGNFITYRSKRKRNCEPDQGNPKRKDSNGIYNSVLENLSILERMDKKELKIKVEMLTSEKARKTLGIVVGYDDLKRLDECNREYNADRRETLNSTRSTKIRQSTCSTQLSKVSSISSSRGNVSRSPIRRLRRKPTSIRTDAKLCKKPSLSDSLVMAVNKVVEKHRHLSYPVESRVSSNQTIHRSRRIEFGSNNGPAGSSQNETLLSTSCQTSIIPKSDLDIQKFLRERRAQKNTSQDAPVPLCREFCVPLPDHSLPISRLSSRSITSPSGSSSENVSRKGNLRKRGWRKTGCSSTILSSNPNSESTTHTESGHNQVGYSPASTPNTPNIDNVHRREYIPNSICSGQGEDGGGQLTTSRNIHYLKMPVVDYCLSSAGKDSLLNCRRRGTMRVNPHNPTHHEDWFPHIPWPTATSSQTSSTEMTKLTTALEYGSQQKHGSGLYDRQDNTDEIQCGTFSVSRFLFHHPSPSTSTASTSVDYVDLTSPSSDVDGTDTEELATASLTQKIPYNQNRASTSTSNDCVDRHISENDHWMSQKTSPDVLVEVLGEEEPAHSRTEPPIKKIKS